MSITSKVQNKSFVHGNASKAKKNWKPKPKKWETKTQPNERQVSGIELGKPNYRIYDNAHYGECWFKRKVKCHNIDKFGHMMWDCHQLKKGQVANYVNQV